MAIKKLYKSRIPSMSYVFQDGLIAYFIGGRFFTDSEAQIAELDAEILLRNPTIYIDGAESTVDTEALDPMEVIKRKAIADYLAQQAAATKKDNDMGAYSSPEKLNMTNSSGVAGTSASSDSVADAITAARATIKSK